MKNDKSHLKGFQEEIRNSAQQSEDSFFTWFDEADSKNSAYIRGAWDFSHHIIGPTIPYMEKPEEKVALEIGYGGGRLLASACRHFGKVIGVDIHDQSERVASELRKRGHSNHKLLTGDGSSLPIEDQSIDFVYSFIVFQHVEIIDILKRYLNETYRVLRPGAVGVLYFGRYCRFSFQRNCMLRVWLDRLLERWKVPGGYREMEAKINHINLLVTNAFIRKTLQQIGFSHMRTIISRRKLPDGFSHYGGQYGIVIKK